MLKQATSLLAAITIASSASAGVATAKTSDVSALPSGNDATAAYGNVSGNDKTAIVLDLLNNADVFGSTYTWYEGGKSDSTGNGPFTSNPETTSGTLNFDSAQDGPFVISLKASNYFSLYYFDESFVGTTGVKFNTIGTSTNGKGKPQDLSHASLFVAKTTPKDPPTGVPSPTAAIAGLGLLGMLAARRRRRG